MKMTHANLLKTVGNALDQWQEAAQLQGCEITMINVTFPDGSTVNFNYLEQDGVWDADTGRANTQGV